MSTPQRRGRPWFVHVYRPKATWVLVRGVRAGVLHRFGVPATSRPRDRGVLVLARRLPDVEAIASALGAVVRVHDGGPAGATNVPPDPAPAPAQLDLLGGVA